MTSIVSIYLRKLVSAKCLFNYNSPLLCERNGVKTLYIPIIHLVYPVRLKVELQCQSFASTDGRDPQSLQIKETLHTESLNASGGKTVLMLLRVLSNMALVSCEVEDAATAALCL